MPRRAGPVLALVLILAAGSMAAFLLDSRHETRTPRRPEGVAPLTSVALIASGSVARDGSNAPPGSAVVEGGTERRRTDSSAESPSSGDGNGAGRDPAKGCVRGRVRGPGGQPAYAWIELRSDAGQVSDGSLEDGTFSVAVEPGTWWVTAVAPGFRAKPRVVTVEAGHEVVVDDIEVVRRTGKLEGSLLDQQGHPFARAVLWIQDSWRDWTIECDETGHFEKELGEGVLSFKIGVEDCKLGELQAVAIAAGRTTVLNLVFRAQPLPPPPGGDTGTMTCVVRLPTGEAVAQNDLAVWTVPRWQSSVNGVLTLAPGAVEVMARHRRLGLLARARAQVRASEETTVDLTLAAQGLSFDGRVILAGGRPVAGFTVELRGEASTYFTTTTDAHGGFTFPGLVDDKYHLIVIHPSNHFGQSSLTVFKDDIVLAGSSITREIVLPSLGSVTGRLVGSPANRPPGAYAAPLRAAAAVNLEAMRRWDMETDFLLLNGEPGDSFRSNQCIGNQFGRFGVGNVGADGSFAIEGLPPGPYWLLAQNKDGSFVERLCDIATSDPIELGDLIPQPGLHVRGRLARPNGEPVTRVELVLLHESLPFAARVFADHEGRFETGSLPSGSYAVRLTPHGRLLAAAELEVARAKQLSTTLVAALNPDEERIVVSGE